MEEFIGLPSNEFIGQSYFDTFKMPDIGKIWLNACQSIIRTGKERVFDQHCRILDKQFRFYGYQIKENMCG